MVFVKYLLNHSVVTKLNVTKSRLHCTVYFRGCQFNDFVSKNIQISNMISNTTNQVVNLIFSLLFSCETSKVLGSKIPPILCMYIL